jgi:putative ABC transport system permease protein
MIKNYFLVAVRNFWRHKVFSAINILGLAIGISASLVIFLLVHYDLSFDKFEPGRDRIYRVVGQFGMSKEDKPQPENCLPVPMAAAIEKEVAGVEAVIPFHTWGRAKVEIPYPKAGEPKTLKDQKDLVAADLRYTRLLSYTWIAGSSSTALSQPYQAVLTQRNAQLYFPNMSYGDVLGKTLVIDDTVQAEVTGIVKDLPGNSDFYFGTIISRATLETARLKDNCWNNWGCTNTNNQLFVVLKPGVAADALGARLSALFRSRQDPRDESWVQVQLQPFNDLHFDTNYDGFDDGRTAHKKTLFGLMVVAALLLALACINFINLTTAQASQRAKEIGIRKTMGSNRWQLALQFLSETFVLTVMALLFSIGITPLLIRVFADFIPPDFHFSFGSPAVLLYLLALVVVVTLLSGFYPALVLSGFRPIGVLKNQVAATTATTRSAWFRKTLTVSQFVIAQVFIIATILVARQIGYALSLDMGFRKDAVLYFRTGWNEPASKRNALVAELQRIPGIDMISVASDPPAAEGTWTSPVEHNDGHQDVKYEVAVKQVDSNYFRLFRLRLAAGNAVPESDTINSVVLNESLAKVLGFRNPQQALGARVDFQGRHPMVVGVAADFHQRSVRVAIQPLLLTNGSGFAKTIHIALHQANGNPDAWSITIGRIEKAYESIYSGRDFVYHFEDETVAKYYNAEQKISRLLGWATGLTIFISCLGLLGLVIYVTNQRTKEIGIRKVIGASVLQLVVLLSRDFMKLIGVAILIAMPIAWWGSQKWLENFAYRIDLSWWIFASGGAVLLCFALAVLCFRTFRAAAANPVDSLRSE